MAPPPTYRYHVAGDPASLDAGRVSPGGGSSRAAGNLALPSAGQAQHRRDMESQDDRYGEQVRSGPSMKLPAFLPYVDDRTGETAQARSCYRLMFADPNVKAALLGKILDVGALDVTMRPANKKDKKSQEVAEFAKWNLEERLSGGLPELCWSVLSGGCIDGFSVCEKVLEREDRGRYAGKIVLDTLKPKDVGNDIILEVDEFKNIVGLRGMRYNSGHYFDPADFLIYRHLPLYGSPVGTSDFRAVYSRWWMLDTATKLRARLLETKTVPVVWGSWKTTDQQRTLEAMLANLKSRNWVSVPEDVKLNTLSLAGASDDVFKSAIADLKHDIFMGIQGAILQALEGQTTEGRGNSQVHRSTADLFVWYLASTVQALLNDRKNGLVRGLVDLNYHVDDYPMASLSAVDVNEMAQEWQIDQGLHAAGLDLSKEELYERYNRRPPVDEADKLPGQGASGAGMQGPPGAPPGLPFTEKTPDVESFCQDGENAGKPGPCPDGKGDAASGKVAAPKDLPQGTLYQHSQRVSDRHHKNMQSLAVRMHRGEYEPDDVIADAKIYADKAVAAHERGWNGRFNRYKANAKHYFPAEAFRSKEWQDVKEAFQAARDDGAYHLRAMQEHVQSLAAIAKMRKSTGLKNGDLDGLTKESGDASAAALGGQEKIYAAIDALEKKFKRSKPTGRHLYDDAGEESADAEPFRGFSESWQRYLNG